jgi:hypothetical protein
MKKIIYLTFIIIFIWSCKINPKFKTIDFESFEITVPENWNKNIMKGTDSYVGGIITDKNDTLFFDIGMYSNDVIKEDFPLVYDKKSYRELSEKEKRDLKKTEYLIVDSFYEDIDLKKYLKQKFVIHKIGCFNAKLITPKNKGIGTTGIYIDSLQGNKEGFNKIKMSFYGVDLDVKTQKEFIEALKSIQFKEYCH